MRLTSRSDIALMPRLRPLPQEREKQKAMWGPLHAFIRNHYGYVTSAADRFPIRFECLPDAELPDALRSMGYDLKAAGTAERLLPQAEEVKQRGNVTTITNQHMVRTTVSVFEFDLR